MHSLEIRKYFSALSTIEGYNNWVIAKVSLRLHANECNKEKYENKISVHEKKKKANYALLIVEDNRLNLEVHLIRLISKNGERFNSLHQNTNKKSKETFSIYKSDSDICLLEKIMFKKDDIIKFVCDVNDENPIHRTKNAVVPGFLLLEHLLQKEDVSSCEIKYILPVFEKEEIEIYADSSGIEAWVWRNKDNGYVKVFEAVCESESQLLLEN